MSRNIRSGLYFLIAFIPDGKSLHNASIRTLGQYCSIIALSSTRALGSSSIMILFMMFIVGGILEVTGYRGKGLVFFRVEGLGYSV